MRPALKKNLIKLFSVILISAFVLILIFVLLVRVGVFGKVPDDTTLSHIKNNTATSIYSVDNKLLGRYYFQNRTNATFSELPEGLIDALVATEDARFFKHRGIDIRSMMRVLVKSLLLSNRNAGGGSTITQQLAKNLFPRKSMGVLSMPVAKVKEMIIARRIEKQYSKIEILELYLNTVPFGENSYGIETASIIFFNKKTNELRLEESAVLVGLLKANNFYNPRKSESASTTRRNTVLNQMVRYGYLDKVSCDSLKQIPIRLSYQQLTHDEGPAPYFREHLRQEVTEILSNVKKADGSAYNIYADGLKIYTTINWQMQTMAEHAVKEHLYALQKLFDRHWLGKEPWKKDLQLARLQIEQSAVYKNLVSLGYSKNDAVNEMRKTHNTNVFTWSGDKDTTMSSLDSVLYHFQILQAGVLAMNGANGDVLTWVGGPDYKFFKYDHIKSKRQVGSTFKPIVYAAALMNGKKPCTFYKNDSVVYEDYDDWTPRNSDNKYGGYYSMKGALANSINTVSAQLIVETGIDKSIELAHKMGIESELPEVPSLALGTGEVSLFEMVNAYCVFLNNGKPIEPRFIRRIEDASGNVIFIDAEHTTGDSIFSTEIAQKMIAMMQGVVDYGTANSLRSVWGLKNDLAGKTGTTQNQTDGWFIALHPKIVVGAWVGGDNPIVRFRNLTYGQGGFMALPIVGRFLNKVYADPRYKYYSTASFNIPDEIYADFDCKNYNDDARGVAVDLFNLDQDIIQDFIEKIFRKKKRKNEVESDQ